MADSLDLTADWEGGPGGRLRIHGPAEHDVTTASELVAFLRSHGDRLNSSTLRILGCVYTFLCMRECVGSYAESLMSRMGKYQDQFFPEVHGDAALEQLHAGGHMLAEAIFPVRSQPDHVLIDEAFAVVADQMSNLRAGRLYN